MVSIKRLNIDIAPAYFPDGGDVLRVSLQVNGRLVQSERVLLNDDMTSLFDYIFEAAREEIRAAVLADGGK